MTPTLPTEIWIDDKNLVRRQKMTMSQTKPTDTTMRMDMHFSDFGKQVRIGPPRGDVKDMTDEIIDQLG